jgi:hypothetical protein
VLLFRKIHEESKSKGGSHLFFAVFRIIIIIGVRRRGYAAYI